MKTRSLIQEHIQQVEAISGLKNRIREINESYNIEEAVFGLDNNMSPKQVVNGYMELSDPYTSLDEALRSVDTTSKGVYVKDSKNIYTGEIRSNLSAVNTNKALDINTLKIIEL